jgi:hypothetical protein
MRASKPVEVLVYLNVVQGTEYEYQLYPPGAFFHLLKHNRGRALQLLRSLTAPEREMQARACARWLTWYGTATDVLALRWQTDLFDDIHESDGSDIEAQD